MFATPLFVIAALAAGTDTLRLTVGSPEVDLSGMLPHVARVTVERLIDGEWQSVVQWTNTLEVADSRARPVHRWTTIGQRAASTNQPPTWELYQTFDAKSIAPLGLRRTLAGGGSLQLAFGGPRIHGTQRAGDGTETPVNIELSQAAFPASASDLVPMAVRLEEGMVMTAPVWQFGMPDAETRVFTVLGKRDVTVEGTTWNAWAVEERAVRNGGLTFIGTWYIVEEPPYMVYAEVVGPGGVQQRMSEVLVENP